MFVPAFLASSTLLHHFAEMSNDNLILSFYNANDWLK